MWNLFEICVNIFQGCMMVQFLKRRVHPVLSHRTIDIVCVLLISLFFSLYANMPSWIPETIIFSIPLLYAVIITRGKWVSSLYWAMVLALEFMTIVSMLLRVFILLPGMTEETLTGKTWQHIVFVLLSNAVLAGMLHAISKIRISQFSLSWQPLLLFIAMNAGLAIAEEAVYQVQRSMQSDLIILPFLCAYLGILECTVLSVFLFGQLSLSVQREETFQQEIRLMKQSRRYNQEIQAMYAQLQNERHDFKQQVQVLQHMLSEGGNRDAARYMEQYQQKIVQNVTFLTGSTAVDALLTSKSMMISQVGLHFHYTTYPLSELPIDTVDFCTILGNILDNAIEGTLRLAEPSNAQPINLTFSRSWDMFYIYCTNECAPETIHYIANGWATSKADDEIHHGIGIRSIQQIVQKAEGRCYFNVAGNIWQAKIVLPFPTAYEDMIPS